MNPAQIVAKLFGSAWRFVRGYSGGSAVNSDGHHGWDISAKLGTPIPALAGGKVVYAEFAGGGGPGYVHGYQAPNDARKSSAFWTTGGGNVVVVEAADGTRYQYAHLKSIGVRVGDTVSPGQMIGQMGDTGDATGSHLHFAMIKTKVVTIARGGQIRQGVEWLDPSAFLASAAGSGSSFNLLGGFNDAVAFEPGHVLTEQDVNDIIAKLDQQHFFQAADQIPLLSQLAENQARDTVRAILMGHVGEVWSPDLQKTLQTQIFGAADAATDNAFQDIGNAAGAIAGFVGALFNPMTYVHTGALVLGVYLAFKGFRWIAEGSGSIETVG
jgi:murein DD-endopeptidase MepM/ murein hydrolase activator NlpD